MDQRVLTASVSIPSVALYYLEPLCRAARAQLASGAVPRIKRPPAGDFPCCPFRENLWRPYLGGALLSLVPTLVHDLQLEADGLLPTPSSRAVVVFDDPRVARTALQFDKSMRRRTAWLMFVDGRWVLRMRWVPLRTQLKSYRFTIGTTTDGRAVVRERTRRKRVRRWQVAPPEWPRDSRGRLVPTRTAIRMLGRATVDRLLGYRWQ